MKNSAIRIPAASTRWEKVVRFSARHPVWHTLFVQGVPIACIFLDYLPKKLGLVNSDSELTARGGWLLFGMVGASLSYHVVLQFALARVSTDDQIRAFNDFMKIMLKELQDLVRFKLMRFNDRINRYIDNSQSDLSRVFEDVTKPHKQIQKMLESCRTYTSEVFDIDLSKYKIVVCCFFSFDAGKTWTALEPAGKDGAVSTRYFSNPKSTFYHLLQSGETHILHLCKRSAICEEKYEPDKLDVDNDNIGSIFCRRMDNQYSEGHQFTYLLSISTYGQRLELHALPDAAQVIQQRIVDLMNVYDSRMLLEMHLLYLRYLKNRCQLPGLLE